MSTPQLQSHRYCLAKVLPTSAGRSVHSTLVFPLILFLILTSSVHGQTPTPPSQPPSGGGGAPTSSGQLLSTSVTETTLGIGDSVTVRVVLGHVPIATERVTIISNNPEVASVSTSTLPFEAGVASNVFRISYQNPGVAEVKVIHVEKNVIVPIKVICREPVVTLSPSAIDVGPGAVESVLVTLPSTPLGVATFTATSLDGSIATVSPETFTISSQAANTGITLNVAYVGPGSTTIVIRGNSGGYKGVTARAVITAQNIVVTQPVQLKVLYKSSAILTYKLASAMSSPMDVSIQVTNGVVQVNPRAFALSNEQRTVDVQAAWLQAGTGTLELWSSNGTRLAVTAVEALSPTLLVREINGRQNISLGNPLSVFVSLGGIPNNPVTVSIATSDGSAAINPPSLQFTPQSWDAPQEISLRYTSAGVVTIRYSTSSSDREFNSLSISRTYLSLQPGLLAQTPSPVILNLDSTPFNVVNVAVDSNAVSTTTLAVAYNPSVGIIKVEPTQLTIGANQAGRSQSFTITGISSGTAVLTFSATGGGYTGQSISIQAFVQPRALSVSVASLAPTFFNPGLLTVALPVIPLSDVTLYVTTNDSALVEAGPTPVTIARADFARPQQVTVRTLGPGTGSVSISAQGGGYDGLSSTIPVFTGPAASMILSTSSIDVLQGSADSGVFTISFTDDVLPTATFTVLLSVSNSHVATVSPSSLVFTRTSLTTPQTVRVSYINVGEAVLNLQVSGGGFEPLGQTVPITASIPIITLGPSPPPTLYSDEAVELEFTLSSNAIGVVAVQVSVDGNAAYVDNNTETWSISSSYKVPRLVRIYYNSLGSATVTVTASGGGFSGQSSSITLTTALFTPACLDTCTQSRGTCSNFTCNCQEGYRGLGCTQVSDSTELFNRRKRDVTVPPGEMTLFDFPLFPTNGGFKLTIDQPFAVKEAPMYILLRLGAAPVASVLDNRSPGINTPILSAKESAFDIMMVNDASAIPPDSRQAVHVASEDDEEEEEEESTAGSLVRVLSRARSRYTQRQALRSEAYRQQRNLGTSSHVLQDTVSSSSAPFISELPRALTYDERFRVGSSIDLTTLDISKTRMSGTWHVMLFQTAIYSVTPGVTQISLESPPGEVTLQLDIDDDIGSALSIAFLVILFLIFLVSLWFSRRQAIMFKQTFVKGNLKHIAHEDDEAIRAAQEYQVRLKRESLQGKLSRARARAMRRNASSFAEHSDAPGLHPIEPPKNEALRDLNVPTLPSPQPKDHTPQSARLVEDEHGDLSRMDPANPMSALFAPQGQQVTDVRDAVRYDVLGTEPIPGSVQSEANPSDARAKKREQLKQDLRARNYAVAVNDLADKVTAEASQEAATALAEEQRSAMQQRLRRKGKLMHKRAALGLAGGAAAGAGLAAGLAVNEGRGWQGLEADAGDPTNATLLAAEMGQSGGGFSFATLWGTVKSSAASLANAFSHLAVSDGVVVVIISLATLFGEILRAMFNISLLYGAFKKPFAGLGVELPHYEAIEEAMSTVVGPLSEIGSWFADAFEFLDFLSGLEWNCGGVLVLFVPLVIFLSTLFLRFLLLKDFLLSVGIGLHRYKVNQSGVKTLFVTAGSKCALLVMLFSMQIFFDIIASLVVAAFNTERSCSRVDAIMVSIGRVLIILLLTLYVLVNWFLFTGNPRGQTRTEVVRSTVTGFGRFLGLTFGVWTNSMADSYRIRKKAQEFDPDPNDSDNMHEEVMSTTAVSRNLVWIAFPFTVVLTKTAEALNNPTIFNFTTRRPISEDQYLYDGERTLELHDPFWKRFLLWLFHVLQLVFIIVLLFSADPWAAIALFGSLFPPFFVNIGDGIIGIVKQGASAVTALGQAGGGTDAMVEGGMDIGTEKATEAALKKTAGARGQGAQGGM